MCVRASLTACVCAPVSVFFKCANVRKVKKRIINKSSGKRKQPREANEEEGGME